jgi:hypothetical protein
MFRTMPTILPHPSGESWVTSAAGRVVERPRTGKMNGGVTVGGYV